MKLKLIALFVIACSLARPAAAPYPTVGQPWYQALGWVPNSSTSVTTADSILNYLHLGNTSGSTVTVTITDSSTACGGSACQVWPAITIAANTVYDNNFNGIICKGGIKWTATTANAVAGFMRGTYVQK